MNINKTLALSLLQAETLFKMRGQIVKGMRASLVAQRLKRLPPMWAIWVPPSGREDSPGKGNGHPLQYSCLENAMDGGAGQATVNGSAMSQT